MLHIKDLSLAFHAQTIFDHISLNINHNDRMGLVGRNGSGKSTLLKAIAKQQAIDKGTIAITKGKRIAYMPQDVVLQSDKTIIDESTHAITDITALQKKLTELEALIESGITDESTITSYIETQEQIAQLEPEKLKAQAERILLGLGFKPNQLNQSVNTLSVGWKMRIVLAKLLLQQADFYLFDEPTNHLDIVAKDWFIQFLQKARFGFLLVCHEKYFLDTLCKNIIALEHGKAKVYTGNYSAFETQYAYDMEQLEHAYMQQQKDLARRQETIDRFRAKASKAKMAKSMEKKLDAIERITLPPSSKKVHFSFPTTKRSGRIVLTTHNVAHRFENKQLFNNINIKIERNDRIALIAANGVGKTTLFNLIIGKIPLQSGSIEFGQQVNYAIFAQDQNEVLNLNKNIFENVQEHCSKQIEQQIRAFLGAFLFNADDIKKKVGVLSGGEKNRVAMAIVLMQDSNFLLLDEPTNHLDMPSKEVLVQALQEFDGTIFFVSHDHTFINQLATHVIELTPHGAFQYHGNYDAYLYQKNKTVIDSNARNATDTKKSERMLSKSSPTHDKKSSDLERKIDKLEQEIACIHEAFTDLIYGTEDFSKNEEKLQKKQSALEQLLAEWEQLQA